MKVIYAGTFDPITNGHLDLIERASQLFDEIIVAVAYNPAKKPLLTLEQRTKLVKTSVKNINNVSVIGFTGLLANLAKENNVKALLRGVRHSADMEYEVQLSQLNNKLYPELETVFLPPSVEWRYLSSTMVREIYHHNGEIKQFVPECVDELLKTL